MNVRRLFYANRCKTELIMHVTDMYLASTATINKIIDKYR